MVKKIAIVLVLLMLNTGSSAFYYPAFGQEKLVRGLYSAGVQDYDLGDYKSALKKLTRAMELSKGMKFNAFEMSQGYLSLAETQRSLGKYKEAEENFKKSIELAMKSGRKKNITLSRVYNNMGALYSENAQFPEAEKAFKASEEIGKDFKYLPINNLASLYLSWGKFDKAEEYLTKSEKLLHGRGDKSLTIPYYYFNMGEYNKLKGNYKEAEQDFEKCLETVQKLVTKSHLYYTISLSGLANLYVSQSRFSEAEKAIRTILDTREKNLGQDNPRVAEAMVLLANVLADQGRYGEARGYALKAIEINKRIFDDSQNLFTAFAKNSLGNIKRQEGRYKEAASLLEDCLKLQTNILGADHLKVAKLKRDLARVKLDQSKFKEAEALYLSAAEIVNSKTGPDHPERAESAKDLGNLYLREQIYDKAESQFLKALQLSKVALGEKSKVTADSARDLGELYTKQGKFDKAVEYLTTARDINKTLFGEDAPQVAADLIALATAYDSLGRSNEANPLLAKASQIKQKLSGGTEVQSPTVTVPIAFSSSDNLPVKDKWALAIGISNFKDPSINLKYAAKDATDFSNFLINKGKFKSDHVKLLTDEQATRENIISHLGNKWLGKHAHKDDLIVVYVSSHGSRSQEDVGGVNFLVAHDTDKTSLLATGIPMQWLTKMIKEQVKSDRVVLILDVCHSGAAAQGGKALHRIIGMDPDKLTLGSGQMVLCSSMAEQVSWESKKYENSVFTRRLIEALQVNNDKTSLLEAYKRLKVLVESEVLRDRSNLQTPMLWNKDWTGRDPVLAVDVAKNAPGTE